MYNNVQQAVKSNQSRIKVRSVYTTNKPLQSSFGSVLRPPFLGGFGPHLSLITMFPPAQTNYTKDENQVGFNQTLQLMKESNHGLHFSVDVEVCSFIGIEVAIKVKGYIQQPLSEAASAFLQEKLAFKRQFLNSY